MNRHINARNRHGITVLMLVANSSSIKEHEKKRLLELTALTPGDFKTVLSKLWLTDREKISHGGIIDSLIIEQDTKQNQAGKRIGF